MSKKSKKRRVVAAAAECPPPVAPGSRRKKYAAAALCILALLACSAAATRFDPVRRAVGLRPLVATPAQGNSAPPLAKEYIYSGGRLVATEEPPLTPSPTPSGPPPTNLVATATSASSVSLTWVAPSGAVGYVVERRSGLNAQPVETSTGSTSPFFNDTTLPMGDFAYLYRVKAVYGSGYSDYGNTDLATTVLFTDDPLQPTVTHIKAVHLTELRRAVNAVRALAGGLAPASWTYPDPVSTPLEQRRKIYLEDVQELRARLDDALGPLNRLSAYPSDPSLARGAIVYAAHFEQIRARIK
jgi:hypothetical protein